MFTIGKLAQHCHTNVETIRYYQRIGLLRIPESQGSYRYYQQQDIDRLRFIQNAKDAGLQLNEIKELLHIQLEDRRQVRSVIQQRLTKIDQRIAELSALKERLSAWIDECQHSTTPSCPILAALKHPEQLESDH